MKPKNQENWKERFDKWFDSDKDSWDNYTIEQVEETRNEAKQFIQNLLASQKAEIVERLKKIKRKPIKAFGDEDLVDGYNQALADVIKVVEEEMK